MQKGSLNSLSPDNILLNELKAGNSSAFDLVFEKYYVNLCRFAYTKIRDEDMSQSLVQNVFIRLWERRYVLGQINNLPAYLTTMVKNQLFDHVKDQKNLDQLLIAQDHENAADCSTENEVFIRNFEECLFLALDKLPPRCRQAFELSRFEDVPNKEIAREMKISVKGVEALIGRSLKILRNELKEFLPSFDLINIDPVLFFLHIKKNNLQYSK